MRLKINARPAPIPTATRIWLPMTMRKPVRAMPNPSHAIVSVLSILSAPCLCIAGDTFYTAFKAANPDLNVVHEVVKVSSGVECVACAFSGC